MSRLSLVKNGVVASVCAVTLFVTGCAFSGSSVVSTSGSTGSLSKGNMGGVAHGGRQGIYGATVTLYAMNTSTANYGDTPTMYARTTTTDSNGDFSFTKLGDGLLSPIPTTLTGNATAVWSCPAGASSAAPGSATDPYMYLVASGGDTSGTGTVGSYYNNSYAKLMVVLGDCASVYQSELVTINEMTTVGSMVALQQFFNPATQAIGAPSTNVVGLTNAIQMANTNLVDIYHGEAQYAVGKTSLVAGVSVTALPESSKLTTMANILAACVSSNPNVSATNCNALATNAVPPTVAPPSGSFGQVATEGAAITNFPSITTYPTVADTLQAVDYMLINPTESQDYAAGSGKFHNLFSLSFTGTQPFTNPAPLATTAQPMDWTVGINFSVSGSCSNVVTTSGSSQGAQAFLTTETGLAIDKNGNIWMGGSAGSTTTGQGDTLVEVSPTGVPLRCIGGNLSAGGLINGRTIAIDSQGNVWWAVSTGLVEVIQDPTNSSYNASSPTVLYWTNTPYAPAGIAADANGNIFIGPNSVASTLYEYVGAATATVANGVTPNAIGKTAMTSAGAPYRSITINALANLATVGNGGKDNLYAYQTSTSSNAAGGYVDGLVIESLQYVNYGLALLSDGTSVAGMTCCNAPGVLTHVNANTGTEISYSGYDAGGTNAMRSVAVDGANNIWSGPGPYANDSTATLNSVGETDVSFNAIAPVGAVVPPVCTSPCSALGGYSKSFFLETTSSGNSNNYGLGIDSSGNVWGSEGNAGLPAFYTIVGQAVPVVTPLVKNIH